MDTAAIARSDCCPVCAGALLAVGITNCGVQDECDPAFALLCESVNHDDPVVRIGAIMGLGLAYAGTQKADVQVWQLFMTTHCQGAASPAVGRVKHWGHPCPILILRVGHSKGRHLSGFSLPCLVS